MATIQERVDAFREHGRKCFEAQDIAGCEDALIGERAWTRVRALVKAAELCASTDENTVLGIGHDAITAALSELRKHGDIPAETGTS